MTKLKTINTSNLSLYVILIVIGIISRTLLAAGPNFEAITAISVVSVYLLSGKYRFLIPVISLLISDLIIGNSAIYLFTWSGFIFGYLLALAAKKLKLRGMTPVVFSSLISVLIFYLWTNLGVVLQGWYPLTIEGLMQSYINAIPFLKPQLTSALIYTPLLYIFIRAWQNKLHSHHQLRV